MNKRSKLLVGALTFQCVIFLLYKTNVLLFAFYSAGFNTVAICLSPYPIEGFGLKTFCVWTVLETPVILLCLLAFRGVRTVLAYASAVVLFFTFLAWRYFYSPTALLFGGLEPKNSDLICNILRTERVAFEQSTDKHSIFVPEASVFAMRMMVAKANLAEQGATTNGRGAGAPRP